jgi:hypothetical protein
MYNVVMLHSAQCTPSVHWASVHWVAIYTGCTLGGNVHWVDIRSVYTKPSVHQMYIGAMLHSTSVHQM